MEFDPYTYNYDEIECPDCDGTGDCPECDGRGCVWCDYTGICPYCDGTGMVDA